MQNHPFGHHAGGSNGHHFGVLVRALATTDGIPCAGNHPKLLRLRLLFVSGAYFGNVDHALGFVCLEFNDVHSRKAITIGATPLHLLTDSV